MSEIVVTKQQFYEKMDKIDWNDADLFNAMTTEAGFVVLSREALEERAVRLLMLRAGGRYRMFEAGQLYECLRLLGMAEYTKREQVVELERVVCRSLYV